MWTELFYCRINTVIKEYDLQRYIVISNYINKILTTIVSNMRQSKWNMAQ